MPNPNGSDIDLSTCAKFIIYLLGSNTLSMEHAELSTMLCHVWESHGSYFTKKEIWASGNNVLLTTGYLAAKVVWIRNNRKSNQNKLSLLLKSFWKADEKIEIEISNIQGQLEGTVIRIQPNVYFFKSRFKTVNSAMRTIIDVFVHFLTADPIHSRNAEPTQLI